MPQVRLQPPRAQGGTGFHTCTRCRTGTSHAATRLRAAPSALTGAGPPHHHDNQRPHGGRWAVWANSCGPGHKIACQPCPATGLQEPEATAPRVGALENVRQPPAVSLCAQRPSHPHASVSCRVDICLTEPLRQLFCVWPRCTRIYRARSTLCAPLNFVPCHS